MVEGKPYRSGLMVAGMAVIAVGLFIMVEEKPLVYGTMCALGVIMLCAGMIWSFCQCYPKVQCKQAVDNYGGTPKMLKLSHLAEPLPVFVGHKGESIGHHPHSHSCPTLYMV
uniref:Barttin n=1 Tax=Periophthalmus magnuspinnatus TaxID=409849 RepID=A0A3B4A4N2_9GOBI